jgi:hypothetical protein
MLPPMNARDTMWSPPVCAVTPATVRTELTRITAGVGGRVAAAVTASAAAVAAAANEGGTDTPKLSALAAATAAAAAS